MERVISQYTTALDELNVLTATSYKLAGGEDIAAIGADIKFHPFHVSNLPGVWRQISFQQAGQTDTECL